MRDFELILNPRDIVGNAEEEGGEELTYRVCVEGRGEGGGGGGCVKRNSRGES